MTGHAKETTKLWDALEMTLPAIRNRNEPTAQYESDPHKLSDLCPKCEEGFIGRDGYCPTCGN